MQYCSLQHWTLLLSPGPSTTGCCFCLASSLHSFWSYFSTISSSILGTYWPGEFIFQCPFFLSFPTVHGVLKARILNWFATPFSSGPHSVRPLHHDLSVLGGPTWHGLVSLWSEWLRSDQISRSVVSDSLRPHESQHARSPCPSPTPGVHWDSRPSSQWCHPAISSALVNSCYIWKKIMPKKILVDLTNLKKTILIAIWFLEPLCKISIPVVVFCKWL